MHLWGRAVHRPPIEYLNLGPKGDSPHTTMGVMGVNETNLIEGVECRGAAAFLEYAAEATVALFI